ncbi:MAG: hypothetical protein ACMVY4_06500 [Minwuia sp.]|uniref:hypothetical protein n=1 Tax=Minwuia sp. TaxID=2493630 RepID=UPI003A89EFED
MRPIAAIAAAFLAIVICAGPSVQAQDSTSRLNAGVLLYSQQNFETARDVFAAIDTPAGRVWLARTQLQLQQYRLAIETATAARAPACRRSRTPSPSASRSRPCGWAIWRPTIPIWPGSTASRRRATTASRPVWVSITSPVC